MERKTGLRVHEFASAGSGRGLSSPLATASGIEKEYRPSMLMCSCKSGESRSTWVSRSSGTENSLKESRDLVYQPYFRTAPIRDEYRTAAAGGGLNEEEFVALLKKAGVPYEWRAYSARVRGDLIPSPPGWADVWPPALRAWTSNFGEPLGTRPIPPVSFIFRT